MNDRPTCETCHLGRGPPRGHRYFDRIRDLEPTRLGGVVFGDDDSGQRDLGADQTEVHRAAAGGVWAS